MLINGRTGGQVKYPLEAEPSPDRPAFETLVNGLTNARGRAKPCALDFDDWLCVVGWLHDRNRAAIKARGF